MITVKLNEQTKPKKEKPFPKLMKSINGSICLFASEYSGYCLCTGNTLREVGDHVKSIKNFTDYNEPITIQNA